MQFMIVDVPKSIFGCLILGWILVISGLKAQRVGDQILVTVPPNVPQS